MTNKNCDCGASIPSATADNGVLDIRNRKPIHGPCHEEKAEDVIIKFEDQSEEINMSIAEDLGEEINVSIADVGTTLVQRIESGSDIRRGSTEFWNSQPSLISEKNVLYVYEDYYQDSYAVKIGDGLAYLIDLPVTGGITQSDIDSWNNKWRGYIDPEFSENLVFTTH